MRSWFDGHSSGYTNFVIYYLPPILLVLFLIFVSLVIVAFKTRAKRERAHSHRKMYKEAPRVERVLAAGYSSTSYEPDVSGPLADLATAQAVMKQGERQGRIALDVQREKAEQVVRLARQTQMQIDAMMALDESVYRAERRKEERRLERLHADLEQAKIQFEIVKMQAGREAQLAVREAEAYSANKFPASVSGSGNGLTADITDAEIRRAASRIAVTVDIARDAGKDVATVVDNEVTALRRKYPPLVLEEILNHYRENYGSL